MVPQRDAALPAGGDESPLIRSFNGFFDADWYLTRYPDIRASRLSPIVHFIRHGISERRDPNAFFDSAWYSEHHADVSAAGMHPLLHYLQAGAAELRNPHPSFDAVYYASQHPEAAANPLLYHMRVGRPRGYPTQPAFHIEDYLPSTLPLPGLPPRVVVDVIVPVYRGLEETRRCIASVLADQSRPLGRLIVIDDRSPDQELVAWLDALSGCEPRVLLLRNQRNIGFVASVNRGMQAAGGRDVVLLNSDTEVPARWLARLTAQAYADPRVATVSPLSNNATICGYPGDDGGPVAFDHPLEEIDAICRTVNAGRWVDAPTTVGFCMFIRRKALRQTGLFDADRFKLGYGEENDFCLRASALGWRHRIACDTFVYHKGSVSFGDRMKKLTARAMALVVQRFPNYQRDIAIHVKLGVINPARFALTAALFRHARLPVILMVTHELGGGVRRHIDTLLERYSGAARFLLLKATDRGAALSVPSLPGHPSLVLPAERMDDLITLLRSMQVARIHIHHLMGMDMDVRALISRLGVPFDVTVHDYYALCPQINLLPWRDSLYCGEPDIAGCNACIANRPSHGARDIITWRGQHAWQFREADRVLCPTQDVITRLRRYGLAGNAVLAPHEKVEVAPWPMRILPPGQGKLRIAVLGTLVNHKGARIVASVAELADPKAIEIHLIGDVEGSFAASALKRMKVTGRYDEADLPALIKTAAPHVIWFPATLPETFSYTLSAAIAAGAPIAATRIGAHQERLDGRPYTWLADVATSPLAWIALFERIRGRLAEAPPAAPVLRPANADFYATQYLQPLTGRRSARRRATPSRPRIAVIPERFDAGFATPCGYIRLVQPLHHPSVTSAFDICLTDARRIFDCQADIIVTQRYAIADAATVERLAAHARRTGARLVFDLDDDLLNIPRSHPEAQILRPRAKIVRQMVDAADHVWVSTPALARRLSPFRNDIEVMENGLDERIWTRPPPRHEEQRVRIVCMGTTSHAADFAHIAPALGRLKTEYAERVSIDVIGMTQHALPPGVNRLSLPPHSTASYPGFVNWLSSVQPGWHIGLAPLLATPFNQGKSSIKAMDYTALGMAVLASDVPVYRNSLADGPAGQLVRNDPAAWYAALDALVRDRAARIDMAGCARTDFDARATLASQSEYRQSAWLNLLQARRNRAA